MSNLVAIIVAIATVMSEKAAGGSLHARQQSVGNCSADWGAALREVAWGSPGSSCRLAMLAASVLWSPTTGPSRQAKIALMLSEF